MDNSLFIHDTVVSVGDIVTAKRVTLDCVDIWICCCLVIYVLVWSVLPDGVAVFV